MELPADLVAFLEKGDLVFRTEGYGEVELLPLEQLKVRTVPVFVTLAEFDEPDPHDGWGAYLVPAVDLVATEMYRLWLPNERFYGSLDTDHGDLMVFPPTATWTQIAASFEEFWEAPEEGVDNDSIVQYLKPWPKYPWEAPWVGFPDDPD